MRGLIRGGWVVGFAGDAHPDPRWCRRVGRRSRRPRRRRASTAPSTRRSTRGASSSAPGFIDTHVHSGHRASHRLISDTGRPDYFGQPFLEISVPREGTRVGGDPRYAPPRRAGRGERQSPARARSRWPSSCATASPRSWNSAASSACRRRSARGGRAPGRARLSRGGLRLGTLGGRRAGPAHAGRRRGGRPARVRGLARLRRARGRQPWSGRVRGLLAPREVETCSLDLLRATRRAADELGLPIVTHAAYSVIEFYEIVDGASDDAHRALESLGLLGPDLTIGHGNLVADNPRCLLRQRPRRRDHGPPRRHRLALSGEHRAAGAHASTPGRATARPAINLALGTDTYPRDLIMQMRTASYFGKVMSNDLLGRHRRRGVRRRHARRRARPRARRPRAPRARAPGPTSCDRSHGRRHPPLRAGARSR